MKRVLSPFFFFFFFWTFYHDLKKIVSTQIIAPVIVKYVEKNLNITKPRYSEHILPVPWPFIKSWFLSTNLQNEVKLVHIPISLSNKIKVFETRPFTSFFFFFHHDLIKKCRHSDVQEFESQAFTSSWSGVEQRRINQGRLARENCFFIGSRSQRTNTWRNSQLEFRDDKKKM